MEVEMVEKSIKVCFNRVNFLISKETIEQMARLCFRVSVIRTGADDFEKEDSRIGSFLQGIKIYLSIKKNYRFHRILDGVEIQVIKYCLGILSRSGSIENLKAIEVYNSIKDNNKY